MEFITISLTNHQAQHLREACADKPGVSPESLIEAWVADKLDLIHADQPK